MLQGEPLQDRTYRKIHVARVVSEKGVDQDIIDNRAVKIGDRHILMKKNETTNTSLLGKLIHFMTKLLRIGQPRIKEFFLIGYLGDGARQPKEFRHFPRSASHDSTGTLSYAFIRVPQVGQALGGETIERNSGMR